MPPDIARFLDHIPAPLALVAADRALEVLYVNPAFTHTFGYAKEDVRTVAEWTARAFDDAAASLLRLRSWQADVVQAQQQHIPIPDRESSVLCQDGSHRDVIVQTSLLNQWLLITYTDISEVKRLSHEVQRQDRQFRNFVEHANDIIYTLDMAGHFTYMSPNGRDILGWDLSGMLGRDFREILHPDDLAACEQAFLAVMQGQRLTGLEYRARHGDGHWAWQASNVGPLHDDAGVQCGLIGVGRDIHLRKQAETDLRLSEARYRLLSDNARDVIWTIAPDGTITHVSPSVEAVRGYTVQEAMQQSLDQILTPDSIAVNLRYFGELLADLAAGRQPKPFRGEMEYLCKDGSTYWCEVIATPILADDGTLVELLGVSRDIAEHKRHEAQLKQANQETEALNRALGQANQQLNRLSTIDTLTGLWNRRHFGDRVAHEIAVSKRYGQPLSLIIFDVDFFKAINDTHGHVVGDQVLVALSQRTRALLRETDLACRWGGEEFIVLMPNTGAQEAVTVAEKLRSAFASHDIPKAGVVTASFGVADHRSQESLDHWISRADAALYAAKQEGRNLVRLATS